MSLTKVSFSMIDGASINVLDYGADATGATNSATAIQAALNAVPSGGELVFPAGTYLINSQLTVSVNSIRIRGEVPYLGGTKIQANAASINLFKVESYGVFFQNLTLNGFETSSVYGENTTCKGIVFQRGNNTKDIDSQVQNCFFDQLETGVYGIGANLEVLNSTFQRSVHGCYFERLAATECRGFVVNGNRFHIIGGVSTDSSVANATAVKFTSVAAFMNQVINNYSDDAKFFFVGPCGHGTQISNNLIHRNRNTAIKILASGDNSDRVSGGVVGNVIGNLTDTAAYIDGYGIYVDGATGVLIANNSLHYIRAHGIWLTNSALKNQVVGNLINCVNVLYATDGAIYSGIKIDSGSTFNNVANNYIQQNLAGGMQYGINVYGDENIFSNNDVYYASGATTFFNLDTTVVAYGSTESRWYAPRQEFQNAAPSTGKWSRGDIVWNSLPTSGQPPGWVCVTTGSPGTWKAMANLA